MENTVGEIVSLRRGALSGVEPTDETVWPKFPSKEIKCAFMKAGNRHAVLS